MTWLEDQLRDACHEAADTVAPQAIRGLELEPGRAAAGTRRADLPRRRGRVLAPVAAAASVAVVAVVSFVVVPRLAGSAPGHASRTRHAPTVTSALAALPRYTVLNSGNSLEVVVTATGRVAGRLRAPARQAFATVVGTAGDRTFFVAADLNPQTSCRAFFYRFSLSADGQPSALTPLPVRRLPGLPTALAANADGSLVGYSVVHCAGGTAPTGSQGIGHIGLIDLAAGKITRQWSYTLNEDYTTDLSMSADGRLLGYSNYQGKAPVGRVLAANAPSGPDQRYSAVVVRKPNWTGLSASGRLMYAMIGSLAQVLAVYDAGNGRQVKVLHTWPAAAQPGPGVADPAGHYVLMPVTSTPKRGGQSQFTKAYLCVERAVQAHKMPKCPRMTPGPTLFFSVNLATGALIKLPFRESGPVGWGMVAW